MATSDKQQLLLAQNQVFYLADSTQQDTATDSVAPSPTPPTMIVVRCFEPDAELKSLAKKVLSQWAINGAEESNETSRRDYSGIDSQAAGRDQSR